MMKQLFILLILAFFPLIILSQDIDSVKQKKFILGFSFSPDYSYRTLKSDNSKINNDIIKIRDTMEIPKFGFTTGFSFGYIFNEKLMLETGLLFSDKGENTNAYHALTYQPTTVNFFSFKYHYLYIDIPVKMNYFLIKKRTKFFVSAGISTNVFLKEKTKTILVHYDGTTSIYIESGNNGFSRVNFAVLAGFGFGYDISEKLYFKIEPQYRRSLNSTVKFGLNNYLYSYGLNTALYWRF